MLEYLIEYTDKGIPDESIFEFDKLDIIDLEKIEGQINNFRRKERKLLDSINLITLSLIEEKKALKNVTRDILEEGKTSRDLSNNPEIIEIKTNIEIINTALESIYRELDFVKSDIYTLRSTFYRK